MGGEKARVAGSGHEVGIETEDDVGFGPGAFKADPGEEGRAVTCSDELHVAAAGFSNAASTTGPGPQSEAKLS